MSQVCNMCDIDKDISEYYLIDGCHPFKRCKTCVKKNKKKPYTSGWQRLSLDVRTSIIECLKDRRTTIQQVAAEHGVNYPNLCYWVRSGKCV